jgi:enoyl-CoA hydratase
LAVRAAKEAMLKGLDSSLEEGLQLEAGLEAYLFTTEDAKEAQQAFLQKRKPEFKGK